MRSRAELDASLEAICERLFTFSGADGVNAGGAITALMSRIGGEGVTTVTVGLARAIVRVHLLRVLVVAFDAGKRGAAAMLGTAPTVFAGFSPDAGAPTPRHCVQAVEDDRLHVLTVDAAAAPGVMHDSRWAQALGDLARSYDIVLVDAGAKRNPLPARLPGDSYRAVLIVDTSRTTEEELRRLRAEFDAGASRPAAVILNKRDYHVPRFLYRYVR